LCVGAIAVMLTASCDSMRMSASKYRSERLQRYPSQVSERALQPGDRIKIQIHTRELRPEILAEVLDDRGFVKLPYISLVKIGGLTPSEAEETIEEEYVTREIYKKDGIQIAIVPPISTFTVTGQVHRRGEYESRYCRLLKRPGGRPIMRIRVTAP